jgi:high-affinity iron transporter
MIGQYLLTFREVLEAALVTSIVLAYLSRSGRSRYSRYVWYGVFSAVAASVVLGAVIYSVYGELPESVEPLFEGVAALIAVAVLSFMIYWMATKGKELKAEVEKRVESIASRGAVAGLVSFAFVAVFREGLETVLFLTPFLVVDAAGTVVGLLLGIVTSVALVYAIFFAGMKISIRRFFYFTSILLVLLAAGLAGSGIHELIEYTGPSSWGWLGQTAYNLNIPEGSLFHQTGAIGSIFAVMFGYSVQAEWARIIVHVLYLAVVLPLVIRMYRTKPQSSLSHAG